MSLALIFMGTPDFAVPALRALHAAGHDIRAVYSQPPRARGRGQQPQPSPVQQAAAALHRPIRTPASLRNPEAQQELAAFGADLAVVVAYGLILPQAVLDAPRLGCVNIHASLLPRWRGAAPIQRALLAGDTETGICLMQMEAGLDTGPVLARRAIPIMPHDTAQTLHDQLSALGAAMIVGLLPELADGKITPQPQPEVGVTYAAKLEKSEGTLNIEENAPALARRIRALTPWPGTTLGLADGSRLKILSATAGGSTRAAPGTLLDESGRLACAGSILHLDMVQPAGKKPMPAADWLRGARLRPGQRITA